MDVPSATDPPTSSVDDKGAEDMKKQIERRLFVRKEARSKHHLLSHDKHNDMCPGCQAKARNKRHFKYSFDREKEEYDNVVTMDQVTIADVEASIGIGNFYYAIVICEVKEDYWRFYPLRTLESAEAGARLK